MNGRDVEESGTEYSYGRKVDQTGCVCDALFRHGVRRTDTGASLLETIRTTARRVCAPERGHRQLRVLALHDPMMAQGRDWASRVRGISGGRTNPVLRSSSWLWTDSLNGGGVTVVGDESFHLIADGDLVHFCLVVHTDPPGFSGVVFD